MPDSDRYDVAVVGAGIAGIFAAYELVRSREGIRVILLEQGPEIGSRVCPIIAGNASSCIGCATCAVMRGFGGAGAYSDGKFNFTTRFGGWLGEYMPDRVLMDLIEYVDSVNQEFGAPSESFSTRNESADSIRRKALSLDLHLLDARCKHIGTERNREILLRQYNWLKDRLEIQCRTQVKSIVARDGGFDLETSQGNLKSDFVVAAPGRAGAEWFADQCRRLGLSMVNNQVDIGVRIELPALVFKEVTDAMYEAKLQYRTRGYRDIVRTFCMNPNGYVVTENTDGIITVNGHSYADPALGSENTNFALLVSNIFTSPFHEPYQYGKRIASLSNMLGGGVLVQRFGDLLDGRRTNEHRLAQGFVRPTLAATPGDLSLVLPKRHLDNIIEMIRILDRLAPGTANHDTLLYGVEVKFYSSRLVLSPELETGIRGLFAVGDGSGITRGLSQAGASGVHAARGILARMQGISIQRNPAGHRKGQEALQDRIDGSA